jgi:hypothetical protein
MMLIIYIALGIVLGNWLIGLPAKRRDRKMSNYIANALKPGAGLEDPRASTWTTTYPARPFPWWIVGGALAAGCALIAVQTFG